MECSQKQLQSCRICGFYDPEYLLYDKDGKFHWDSSCLCCNAQTGLHDLDISDVRYYRGKWLAKLTPEEREALKEQMKNIRPDFL